MSVLMVPGFEPDEEPWPTLGPQVVDWMESFLVFGPGPVQGEPYTLDPEKKGIIYRLYEVFPQGHPRAGRRRFKRAGISVRKGWAKTEMMAALAAGELHPDAPVRCDGFDANGQPVGCGVKNPYIPLVAFTEEQVEELAFGALVKMLGEGPLADDFDLGDGDARSGVIHVLGRTGKSAGKAVALAAAPSARDGARTTFQGFDETHRQDTDRLRHAHETMLNNLPKLGASDAWALEVTTSFEPGKDSIAERTHNYAKRIATGKVEDSSLFYYHRQAGKENDDLDLSTREARMAALIEASGPAAEWTDLDYALTRSYEDDTDLSYWERVWLNRIVTSGRQFFPIGKWDALSVNPAGEPEAMLNRAYGLDELWMPPKKTLVTLGFDGSRTRDGTGIVVTDVLRRRQAVVAYWECPRDKAGKPVEGWEVPRDEVDTAMDDAFKRWDVALAYCDPYWWEELVATWHGRYGTRKFQKRRLHRVVVWDTNRPRPMALSLRAYRGAIVAGEVTHNGDPRLRDHLANARKRELKLEDDEGKPLSTIGKERRGSPELIDLAMAADLSWEGYRDAVSLGVTKGGTGSQLHAW